MRDPSPAAPDAPLRLTVGLPRWARRLCWLPVALAAISAWSVGLSLPQALALTLLATLPVALARDTWRNGTLVLRPDSSAELRKGNTVLDATASGRAWLLGGLSVLELRSGTGHVHVVVCASRNEPHRWRRARGWIRLGRLGTGEEPGTPLG